MERNTFLQAALAYAALGYKVFPLLRGDKRPATEHGFHDATNDDEKIVEWWESNPFANVGLATEGMVVVDVDGEANPWLAEDHEKLASLSAAPIVRTPRGGRHYWFKQPPGKNWSVSISRLAEKVDTRANGGYVATPPSAREEGRYSWVEGAELTCVPEDLPLPPTWLQNQLDAIQGGRAYKSLHSDYSNEIPEGARNSVLASIAGTLRRNGFGLAEMLASLKAVNKNRCNPPLLDKEVETIAHSIGRYEPDQIATTLAEGRGATDPFADERADGSPEDPGAFPADLLEVPGLVGEVIDYTLGTSPRRQPVFALAGALTLLSTLTGRKLRDPSNVRTNLYSVVIGKSGSGKDRSRVVNKEILIEAGADRLLGPEEIQSGSGLLRAVKNRPACLIQPDEIGRLLQTVRNPRSNPHLFSIVSNLLKLYSSSGSSFRAGGYADTDKNKDETINQPHVAFLGTTVPESFLNSMTSDDISNGFLSRLIIFFSAQIPDMHEFDWEGVPESISWGARTWREFNPSGSDTSELNPIPKVVRYAPSAKSAIQDFQNFCDDLARGKGLGAGLWVRAAEKARKLAILYAASEQGTGVEEVSETAMCWGMRLSEYSTRQLLWLAYDWVAENPYEADSKRLLRLIRDLSPITARNLSRRTRWLRAKDRDQILAGLIDAGLVVKEVLKTGGRPSLVLNAIDTKFCRDLAPSGTGGRDRSEKL